MVTFPSSSDEEDLRTDPAYEDTSIQSDSNSKSESEAESIMGADPTVLYAVIHSEVLTKKRKERREIADLIPERPEKIPRTTEWRNRKGKTKKARAKLMQPSMASLFKVIPKSGPTKSINNQHLVHEIIDLDSGTEIIKPVPVSPEHSRPVREVPVTENRGRWISEAWPTGVKGENASSLFRYLQKARSNA
ncbi:hypothetical protein NP233_g2974 [Leucocoprinus birnbaumii]|uniref:Uncharacterized protein n=1 Tax=Leucocoprinus birnbaumii TaxID=56174 RepID=A0AAD5YYB3_9AGAR|nr:hypothetical protein NP233_g2974 [Leucocoprinus birnbaumii]